MRLPRRRSRSSDRRAHVVHGGTEALLIALHGYGSTETQFSTLVPIHQPIVQVALRAPLPMDPGYAWWTPEQLSNGLVDLAPHQGVEQAIDLVQGAIISAQSQHGFRAERTILLGYSQGAMLALLLAARCPDLFSAVATGAGYLLSEQTVSSAPSALHMLVMNGSLDALTTQEDHDLTVNRFAAAGHHVVAHRDPVPHVIDQIQAQRVDAFVHGLLELWRANPGPDPSSDRR